MEQARLADLQSRLTGNAKIDLDSTARALQKVRSLSIPEKESLCKEIFCTQPNLLGSVLCLKGFGVSFADMEVAVTVLMVCIESVRAAGVKMPMITESAQDRGLERIAERGEFAEGWSHELKAKAIEIQVLGHPEVYLLSLALGILKEHGLHEVKDEAGKMLVLCVLNIVETITSAVRGDVG